MTSRKPRPWERPLQELTAHDWLTAVTLSSAHRDAPSQLRCAIVLVRFTAGEMMIAYPTMETIGQYAGCDRVNASVAIGKLAKSGAVIKQRITDLPKEMRTTINRDGRGNVYALNICWAFDQLSMRNLQRRRKPDGLNQGRNNVTEAFTQFPNSMRNGGRYIACNGGRYAKLEGTRIGAGKKEERDFLHLATSSEFASSLETA